MYKNIRGSFIQGSPKLDIARTFINRRKKEQIVIYIYKKHYKAIKINTVRILAVVLKSKKKRSMVIQKWKQKSHVISFK